MKFEFSAGAMIYKIEKERIKLLFLISPKKELDIPKGHIEKGENSYEAAKREIKEESGLDVEFLPYFKYTNKYFFSEGGERVLKRVVTFIAKVDKDAKVKVSYEHIGFRWLEYDEAMKEVKYKDMKVLVTTAFEYIKKYEAIQKLNEEYKRLSESEGWALSKRFVPGEGPLNAKLMLIGQAPGGTEDKELRPFVGRSGKLLDSLLKKNKISREDVYITSVVQFFPPKNRAPTEEEIELCKPFLLKQIEIIKPSYIITLGSIATYALLGLKNVEENHGKIIEKDGVKYLVTYHPAAALRFPDVKERMEKDFKKFSKIMKS